MTDDANEKKKRVIHTRVPESLDKELKEKASALGISVSNLVRNVLQNTFGLVGDIVADTQKIADSALLGRLQDTQSVDVIGWQEFVLNRNAVCAECNEILPKGSKAAISVTDGHGPRTVVCVPCTGQEA